jgi:Mor family transcriptional regulator
VAVWQAFTGRNHLEVMKKFEISRRLLYSILARRRKGVA